MLEIVTYQKSSTVYIRGEHVFTLRMLCVIFHLVTRTGSWSFVCILYIYDMWYIHSIYNYIYIYIYYYILCKQTYGFDLTIEHSDSIFCIDCSMLCIIYVHTHTQIHIWHCDHVMHILNMSCAVSTCLDRAWFSSSGLFHGKEWSCCAWKVVLLQWTGNDSGLRLQWVNWPKHCGKM